jgi:hypothetical protein
LFGRVALTRAQPARPRLWSHAHAHQGMQSQDKEAEIVSEAQRNERCEAIEADAGGAGGGGGGSAAWAKPGPTGRSFKTGRGE